MKEEAEKKLLDVDKIINEKSPKLYKFMPGFVLSWLKRILHQDELNSLITENPDKYGVAFGEACLNMYGIKIVTKGLDKIDTSGHYLFVANHPLGGLDGIVFLTTVGSVFDKIKFPVNDILMHIGKYNDIFVPINKHGAQAKDSARLIEGAFAGDAQMLFFPAGMVSRKINGKITDLEWKTAFVKKAIQHQRTIIPVHIEARNSNFFYNLSRIRTKLGIKANIEMLYLVDEMFKQRNATVSLRFGEPIAPSELQDGKSPKRWAEKIKGIVYDLAE